LGALLGTGRTAELFKYSNAKPMNIVGSTKVTPVIEAVVKAHGNHEGK
jgi:hypothetical protein